MDKMPPHSTKIPNIFTLPCNELNVNLKSVLWRFEQTRFNMKGIHRFRLTAFMAAINL